MPFFSSVFAPALEQPPPVPSSSKLADKILLRVAQIKAAQGQYQPIYGLDEENQQSPRLSNLLLNCSFVCDHFKHVSEKHHVRIVDVGCNIGFITFTLAETFSNIIGIDINSDNISLCNDLKTYTKSPARFFQNDFVKLTEFEELDGESVDCVLLFNVVHQVIFARGLAYTRRFLARLAKRVDVIFVELANKEEYVAHGKDHLLPDDPAAVLLDCKDCRIQLLKRQGRRVYKISRSEANFGPIRMRSEKVWFSGSPTTKLDRKYYLGGGSFLKVFRGEGEHRAWGRETQGLLQMMGTMLAPEIIDWTVAPSYGAVLMEQSGGRELRDAYAEFTEAGKLTAFVKQYLDIAAVLGGKKLYHNDMSAHNIYVLDDATIRVCDFEQTCPLALIDPFAVMLWTIYDILSKEPVSYRKCMYEKLLTRDGSLRTARTFYPQFASFALDDTLPKFLDDAAAGQLTWFEFVAKWSAHFHSA